MLTLENIFCNFEILSKKLIPFCLTDIGTYPRLRKSLAKEKRSEASSTPSDISPSFNFAVYEKSIFIPKRHETLLLKWLCQEPLEKLHLQALSSSPLFSLVFLYHPENFL